MDTEEIRISEEMEQMRSQYELLKSKLESQEIINERLLKESMKTKVGRLESKERMQYALAVIAALLSPAFHFAYGTSWYFVGATALLMLVCGYFTWRFHRKVHARDLDNQDLLTVAKNVSELKQNYAGWLKWGVILIVSWLGGLAAEIFMNNPDDKLRFAMLVAVGVGALVGAVFGLLLHRKVLRTCDEIISQIEE